MAKYALVGIYQFLDSKGIDVTSKFGSFNVAPKTEVPTSFVKGPGGNENVRFIFTEKGRWEYQKEDPKEGWRVIAFNKGEFTEGSTWLNTSSSETLFTIQLKEPPTVFGIIFDNNKNIISNNSVYGGSVQWEVRKSTTDKWEEAPILSEIIDGKIELEGKEIKEFQQFAEVRATILVNGFQNKQITFNPKILSNRTGELPLRILMDRVSKADKKQAIIDGLETKKTNVQNKLK